LLQISPFLILDPIF